MPTTNSQISLSTEVVTLSSTEIKNLSSTPVQIVAAPGTGYIIVPLFVVLVSKYGTAAYSGSGPLYLTTGATYNSSTQWMSFSTNTLSQPQDELCTNNFSTLGTGIISNESNFDNKPVVLSAAANPTLGDGTLEVIISYYTLKV